MLFLELSNQYDEKEIQACKANKEQSDPKPENPYKNDHASLDSLTALPGDVESVRCKLDNQQIAIINSQTRALLSEHVNDESLAAFRPSWVILIQNGKTETFLSIPVVGKSGGKHTFFIGNNNVIRLASSSNLPRIICPELERELLAMKDDHIGRQSKIKEKRKLLMEGLPPKVCEILDDLPTEAITPELIQKIQNGEFIRMGENASHVFEVALRSGKFHRKASSSTSERYEGFYQEMLEAISHDPDYKKISDDEEGSVFKQIILTTEEGYTKTEERTYIFNTALQAVYEVLDEESILITDTIKGTYWGNRY